MSKALSAMLMLGVAAVVIYAVWRHYQEDEEISAIPPITNGSELEIPSVPSPEEAEEEIPYTPLTSLLKELEDLANLEYADLHVCPVDAVSFPSMSAMLWHVKLDHPSFDTRTTFPRYNKICVLLRILTTNGDPAVGINVKLYQGQTLKGQFITDIYGCGDFIRMDAGKFRIVIDQTADYRGKELLLTLDVATLEAERVDMAGNKSTITVVVARFIEVSLEKHGWVQIGPTLTGTIEAPMPAGLVEVYRGYEIWDRAIYSGRSYLSGLIAPDVFGGVAGPSIEGIRMRIDEYISII